MKNDVILPAEWCSCSIYQQGLFMIPDLYRTTSDYEAILINILIAQHKHCNPRNLTQCESCGVRKNIIISQ